jgi:hypothetical protein
MRAAQKQFAFVIASAVSSASGALQKIKHDLSASIHLRISSIPLDRGNRDTIEEMCP